MHLERIDEVDRQTLPVAEPASIPGITPFRRRLLRYFFWLMTRVNPRGAALLALALFTTPWRGRPSATSQQLLRQANRTRLRRGPFSLQVFRWPAVGPTVIVMHGWSSCAGRQAPLIERLWKAGFTVVAFDAPGHGVSSGLRSDLRAFEEALLAVIDWSGARAVVGHSLGARAALLGARSSVSNGIGAIALFGMPPDVRHMMEQFKAILGLRSDVRECLEIEFARLCGSPPETHRPSLVSDMQVPVLIVHDENDDVAPAAHARHLAAQLSHAELLMTRGLNHCGILTDAATLDGLVEFLSRHLTELTTPRRR